jgi:surface carbohydrate biosynthesis protein
VLLSCVAAEWGFGVVVGSQRDVNLVAASLPSSVYLHKAITKNRLRMFGILERMGHWNVSGDEEGIVYYDTESYWRAKVHGETMRRARALLAWGPENARIWREHPASSGVPVEVTGNARVDLLRPELRRYFDEEVEALRRRLGEFVIVNTNFGKLNHYVPALASQRILAEKAGDDPRAAEDFDTGVALHRTKIFQGFLEMVPALARSFPDLTVVVRPHPSENRETWERATEGRGNVRVIHEGTVVPWIAAARAVIHNGCTTAVESYVMGTPAIAYQPHTSERFDLHFPNRLSHVALDLPGLCKLVGAARAGEMPADVEREAERRELIDRYVAARSGPFASERIVDVLERCAAQLRRAPRPGAWDRIRGWFEAEGRAVVKRLNHLRPNHINSRGYVQHKFPDLPKSEIETRIARFRAVLGRFDSVTVREHSRNVFELRA